MSGPGTSAPPGPERPLRADAARNHRRIVDAAAAAFEDDGPDVALDEIARRAGVGVATLYRRFRTRDQLVRAVVEEVFTSEIEPTAAPGGDDPWTDLAGSLTRAVEVIAGRRTLVRLARGTGAFDVGAVQRYGCALTRLLDRARDAGVVRAELTARDLSAVLVMALAVTGPDDGDRPAADRYRYLALLLDGMRPGRPRLPEASGDDAD